MKRQFLCDRLANWFPVHMEDMPDQEPADVTVHDFDAPLSFLSYPGFGFTLLSAISTLLGVVWLMFCMDSSAAPHMPKPWSVSFLAPLAFFFSPLFCLALSRLLARFGKLPAHALPWVSACIQAFPDTLDDALRQAIGNGRVEHRHYHGLVRRCYTRHRKLRQRAQEEAAAAALSEGALGIIRSQHALQAALPPGQSHTRPRL